MMFLGDIDVTKKKSKYVSNILKKQKMHMRVHLPTMSNTMNINTFIPEDSAL